MVLLQLHLLSRSSSTSAGILFIASSAPKLLIRTMSSVAASIESKLSKELQPLHLEIRNESHMHNVPANSETHFKVIVVSEKFVQLPTPLQRHRRVNEILKEELQGPVHALSIVTKTPEQWKSMQESGSGSAEIGASPSCRGGDGSLPPKK
jgi:stress-induced morphogen